jgi:hypothetical protein
VSNFALRSIGGQLPDMDLPRCGLRSGHTRVYDGAGRAARVNLRAR